MVATAAGSVSAAAECVSMFVELAAAALICIDPGHGTDPSVAAQREPIGPGSTQLKIKDGGGAPGEADVVLAIAKRTRALLLARGYRVAMTRTTMESEPPLPGE